MNVQKYSSGTTSGESPTYREIALHLLQFQIENNQDCQGQVVDFAFSSSSLAKSRGLLQLVTFCWAQKKRSSLLVLINGILQLKKFIHHDSQLVHNGFFCCPLTCDSGRILLAERQG